MPLDISSIWILYKNLGLGNMDKIKYNDILDQIPQYRYYKNIIEMAVDALFTL